MGVIALTITEKHTFKLQCLLQSIHDLMVEIDDGELFTKTAPNILPFQYKIRTWYIFESFSTAPLKQKTQLTT